MQDHSEIKIIGSQRLLPRELAAQVIGKSVVTLKRYAQSNKGPPITRIGRDVYYEESNLEQWVRSLSTGQPE